MSGEAADPPAAAADAGIHCIPVPTPFLVGKVNCYLIEDDPLTLVDTGPNCGDSLDVLEQALRERGHRVEDLGLIVLTHQHIDHIGLLEILSRRSGAEVAAIDLLVPYLADFAASAEADDRFAMRVMLRHGVPAELASALGSVGEAFRAFGSGGRVTRPLRDSDTLTLRDRALQIRHRPGHSPSDTLLHDAQRRITLAGDHLLAHISSNPLISRPLSAQSATAVTGDSSGADRPRALVAYVASMRDTRELDTRLILGGHGAPVTDHVALADERLRMHERRARKLLRMLAPAPLTAYELASRMWGNVAVTQAYLTISEVLGHLDLLIADGRVREEADRPVTRFAAV